MAVPIIKKIKGRIVKKRKKKKTNTNGECISLTLDLFDSNDHNKEQTEQTSKDTNTTTRENIANKTIHIDAELSLELQRICYVGAHVGARILIPDDCHTKENEYEHEHERNHEDSVAVFRAIEIRLIRCAPDPNAVEFIISAFGAHILEGHNTNTIIRTRLPDVTYRFDTDFAISILPTCLGGSPEGIREVVHALNDKKGRARRLEIAKQVRSLNGILNSEKVARQRTPRTRQVDLDVLDRLEHPSNQRGWSILDSQISPSLTSFALKKIYDDGQSNHLFNIPDDNLDQISSRGSMTRADYHLGRKWPQVEWMVSRLKQIENQKKSLDSSCKFRHILDVGCGRGDLGAAIASEFTDATVTVLDKNKQSLDAARAYSKRVGCYESMHFIEADFLSFVQKERDTHPKLPQFDVIVALHSCGDLTDLVLEYARDRSIPFAICPCCFNKRFLADRGFCPRWYQFCMDDNDIAVLQRLAESNIRPVSLRSMTIINSMRMHAHLYNSSSKICKDVRLENSSDMDHQTLQYQPNSSLEQYSSTFSLRNMVLINDK